MASFSEVLVLIHNDFVLLGDILLSEKVEVNLPRDGQNAHDEVSDGNSSGVEPIKEFDGCIDIWCLTHLVAESALGLLELRIAINCAVCRNLHAARVNLDVQRLGHTGIFQKI